MTVGRLQSIRHSTKLIVALRTAVEKGEGTLDKEATSHDDLLDAFRMSLQYWVIK
ncbi:MAG: hypothetical protein WAM26_17025 [Nitrososphaeraceae archaeon]